MGQSEATTRRFDQVLRISVPSFCIMNKVVGRNGVELKPGQKVLAHQNEGTREAIVVQVFSGSPTVNQVGHWVDVNINNQGLEGIPSYILEVLA
jgi:hypothetical protein